MAASSRPSKTDHAVATDQAPTLSYEQAREELLAVVQKLESGGAPLGESLALWERGEELARLCQDFLDGAQARVDAARPAAGGDDPTAQD